MMDIANFIIPAPFIFLGQDDSGKGALGVFSNSLIRFKCKLAASSLFKLRTHRRPISRKPKIIIIFIILGSKPNFKVEYKTAPSMTDKV